MNPTYLAIARLLAEIAPVVFEGDVFALKGGTAINLFLREMPRLSVDLDLAFRDHRLPRAEALAAINEALRAAMDRQHPRDLFDVMELFAHGGITPAIRRAFVVYLASHNRTLHEVLFPTPKDIRLAFEGSFDGMTTEPVTLEVLLETRGRLFRELPAALDANEREFLRTLVRAEPEWLLLGIPHLGELPAIRWRLHNLRQLARTAPGRFRALADSLDTKFEEPH